MDFKTTYVDAVNLPDAWFQCISAIIDDGFRYEIQHGSYVGQTRLEFDQITVFIKHPYAEPYDLMLPEIPTALNIPDPVEKGYIEQYAPYLLTDAIEPHEQYTYGSRMQEQIKHWCEQLKYTPNTNQAILQVGEPNDVKLEDPPCLRHIDMRIKGDPEQERENIYELFKEAYLLYPDLNPTPDLESIKKDIIRVATDEDWARKKIKECEVNSLIFYPYFRSWDLWGGFPANLAGIAVLQKYMADEIGIESGPICATSKGLHIYGYVEELAKLRCNKS